MSDHLVHYGIRGQKWGDRRYQYEDGTYTPEGKMRRGKKDGRNKFFSMKSNKTGAHPKFSNKKKFIRKMSNSELQRRNKRLELENRYRKNLNDFNYLNSPVSNALNTSPRRDALAVISKVAAIPLTSAATLAIAYAVKKKYPEGLKYLFKMKGG